MSGYEKVCCLRCRAEYSVSTKSPVYHTGKHRDSASCVSFVATSAGAPATAAAAASQQHQQKLSQFFSFLPKAADAFAAAPAAAPAAALVDDARAPGEAWEAVGVQYLDVEAQTLPCYGALHEWPREPSVWHNFPGDNAALAKVCALVAPAGRFQSTSCIGFESVRGTGCGPCRDLEHKPVFTAARERARRPATDVAVKALPTQYLTRQQLVGKCADYAEQLRSLRLALFSSSRVHHRALERVAVHSKLLQCLATADV